MDSVTVKKCPFQGLQEVLEDAMVEAGGFLSAEAAV